MTTMMATMLRCPKMTTMIATMVRCPKMATIKRCALNRTFNQEKMAP
uniref:Uncharacterized protein n=1 Tax=Ciona intestinalis TaxID=7719 RepID=H2XM90_CIOIN